MKTIVFSFLLGLFCYHGHCQNSDSKIMLLISTRYWSDQCQHVAFRISEGKIEIDNCFISDSAVFNSRIAVDLDSEPTLRKIFETPTVELTEYEKKINATNCDFVHPIFIVISEGGVETKVEWKGVRNCYPEPLKATVEELEKIFEKYK